MSGKCSSLREICGYLNFLAAHSWAKPHIWPQSSFLCSQNNEMWCLEYDSVFFSLPVIATHPLYCLSSPLTTPRLTAMYQGLLYQDGGPKPQGQHGIIFYWLVGGFLWVHPCFLAISFNLAYNYATIVPARINQPSQPKHVHPYPNVIYLKCHAGVSILQHCIGFYFLLK